jgi:hypothetical protein
MSAPVYVLRSPPQILSRSLYSSDDPITVTFGVAAALRAAGGAEPGEVLRSGNAFPFKVGHRVTYEQLLDVLMQSKKVVTL